MSIMTLRNFPIIAFETVPLIHDWLWPFFVLSSEPLSQVRDPCHRDEHSVNVMQCIWMLLHSDFFFFLIAASLKARKVEHEYCFWCLFCVYWLMMVSHWHSLCWCFSVPKCTSTWGHNRKCWTWTFLHFGVHRYGDETCHYSLLCPVATGQPEHQCHWAAC